MKKIQILSQRTVYDYVRTRNLLGEVATVAEFLADHPQYAAASASSCFSLLARAGSLATFAHELSDAARLYLRRHGIRQLYVLSAFAHKAPEMQLRELNARILFPNPLAKPTKLDKSALVKPAPVILQPEPPKSEPVIEAVPPAPVERRPRHNPQPDVQERKRLPRVLVVGLLPSQQQTLKKTFEGIYQLSFLKKDGTTSADEVVKAGRACDFVVFHTDHLSHSTLSAQRKLSNTLLVPGSVTKLVAKLHSMRQDLH